MIRSLALIAVLVLLAGCGRSDTTLAEVRIIESHAGDEGPWGLRRHMIVERLDTRERVFVLGNRGEVGDEFAMRFDERGRPWY